MTEFKPGDRVTAMLTDKSTVVTGVLLGKGQAYEFDRERSVLPDGSEDGDYMYVIPETLRAASPSSPLSFVGPEPELATAPAVTTPFKVNSAYPRTLTDSRGNVLAEFAGAWTSGLEDQELAALVADLLNNHFNKAVS